MTEKPEECECCHHKTTELTYFQAEDWHRYKVEWLCNVCANTYLPGFVRNPSFELAERANIMLHVTLCTHLILDALKRK